MKWIYPPDAYTMNDGATFTNYPVNVKRCLWVSKGHYDYGKNGLAFTVLFHFENKESKWFFKSVDDMEKGYQFVMSKIKKL